MKINVGSVTYKIKIKEHFDVEKDRNCIGGCDYDNTTINIRKSISKERKLQVLFHELTHAIAQESGIEMNEENVDQFSKVLLSVVRSNHLYEIINLLKE